MGSIGSAGNPSGGVGRPSVFKRINGQLMEFVSEEEANEYAEMHRLVKEETGIDTTSMRAVIQEMANISNMMQKPLPISELQKYERQLEYLTKIMRKLEERNG